MRARNVEPALDHAFKVGMHQHRGELRSFLEWLLDGKLFLHHVLEIGALHGGTATLFGHLSTGTVISVDLPNGRFGGADHNLSTSRCEMRNQHLTSANERFVGVLGDSHDVKTVKQVRRILGNERVDLLFIDGDHTYEGVKMDYELYRDLVAPGGVIAFHDVNDTDFHRDAFCEVPRFWKSLEGEKHVFTDNQPWGGIGALRV